MHALLVEFEKSQKVQETVEQNLKRRSHRALWGHFIYDMLYRYISEWISDNKRKEIMGSFWLGNQDLVFDIRISDFATKHEVKNQISNLKNPFLQGIIIIISYPTYDITKFLLLRSFKRRVLSFNPIKHLLFLNYFISHFIPTYDCPNNSWTRNWNTYKQEACKSSPALF